MSKRICGQPSADELDRIKQSQSAALNHEHRARQTSTQPATGTLSVFRDRKTGRLLAAVDGVPISNAVSVTFTNAVGETPHATIECVHVELEP